MNRNTSINLDKQWTKHFVLDVESDGPCPGLYNMISFGLSSVFDPTQTFYSVVIPITLDGIPEARAVSGINYAQQCATGIPVVEAIQNANEWIASQLVKHGKKSNDRITIWSDNPAFDWQFWNYYHALAVTPNQAGFSARRIGDLWAGVNNRPLETQSWKNMRVTKHTHNPADDARGNAEALQQIIELANQNAEYWKK